MQDLVHKLTYLMWHDWHCEVRKASAQALGKTGHGKDVHDELRQKLLDESEHCRLEAVSRLGNLGTVEPVLKDHSIGHKYVLVVSQDRFSLVTGST